ncbi:MAG: hypothetical protein GQ562_02365 [Anaerolineales bacterium]|nr:hypothetical protein [Anaerolineales bacterium]
MSDQKIPLQKRPASWIGISLVIGAGVGAALNDIPLGIGLGMLIGAIISLQQKRKQGQDKGEGEV